MIPKYKQWFPPESEQVLTEDAESPESSKSQDLLLEVLRCLHAQYMNYLTSHWQSSGENAYGNHLLFERLYTAIRDEIDTLAEKMVGFFDESAVDAVRLTQGSEDCLKRWGKTKDAIERGIISEKELQDVMKRAYDRLTDSNEMSLGLDDFLMATANAHETHLYLLGQVKRK